MTPRAKTSSENYRIYPLVGRLLGARVRALPTVAVARVFCDEFREAARRMPPQIIVCADYRAVAVYGPEVADELKALMIGLNSHVLRSAILVHSAHATGAMQVSRIAAESGHEARRRFTERAELLTWLAEVSSPEEQHGALAFFADGPLRAPGGRHGPHPLSARDAGR